MYLHRFPFARTVCKHCPLPREDTPNLYRRLQSCLERVTQVHTRVSSHTAAGTGTHTHVESHRFTQPLQTDNLKDKPAAAQTGSSVHAYVWTHTTNFPSFPSPDSLEETLERKLSTV